MEWKLKELFKKGQWKVPFLGVIATGKVDGHDVRVSMGEGTLKAYVSDVGIFELPFSEIMNGLDFAIAETLKPHIPTEPKDVKPPAEIGTRPGAGNPKPTKIKNGAVHRALRWLETELAKEGINEIIMLDAVLQTGISQGSIWVAVMKLTTEQPNTYEYYQDLTKKYHPKGIRKIEVVE